MIALKVFRPLANRDYRHLWLAQFISLMGDKVHQIAMSVLVYKVTGSLLQVGVMLAATTLPAVLFGLPAGVLVDRWPRRRTMIVADILRAAIVFSIPWAVTLGTPFIFLAAFLVASVSLFFEPARLSLIPEVVGSDELMAANALDNVTTSVSELFGLAFGAALVAAIGTEDAFLFDALTYVLSAVFVARVRRRAGVAEALAEVDGATRFTGQVKRALRHLREVPVLLDLMVVRSCAAVGMAGTVTIVHGLAFARFGSGSAESKAPTLAFLDAVITVGLLLGSYTVGSSGEMDKGRKYLLSLTIFSVDFLVLAWATSVTVAAALLFIAGVLNMWFLIPGTTIVQSAAAPEYRGRIFAIQGTALRIATVFGFVGAGALLERVGVSTTIVLTAGLLALVAAYGWSRPALRAA